MVSAFAAIDVKLLRDFRRLSVQGLAIALVLAAGVTVILMSVGMSRALEETLQTYYDRHRFAQVFAGARRAPVTLLQEIQAIDGVATIEAQVRGYAVLDLPGRSDPATGLLISRPEFGEQRLNVPLLRSGHWPDPDSSQQVVVNEPFAEENGFQIGDSFVANLNGSKRELIITGTALSPEFVYTIGPGALMPDSSTYGILWMSAETVESAYGMSGAFSDISLTLVPRAPVEPVLDALNELLEPYGGEDAIEREDQVSNAFVQTEIDQLQALAYILPPVFLGITVFLVNMVMGRIVFLERTEIGLMKAIGYSNAEICVHYLMLAGLIAVLGIGIGWVAGSWLALEMADLYAKYYDFPFLVFGVPSSVYALSAILGLAATSMGALRSALKAARLAPAVAMSPPAPPNFRQSFADRLMGLARLAQPTRMILRSLVRWPVRAAMTSLGMALAVSVLVASNFFPDAMDEIVDKGFYQSNRQDYMLLFDEDEPLAALQEVQNLPGVLQAEPQQSHAAVLRSGHLEKRLAVSAFPKDADLSRIVDNEGRVITAGPAGVVISDRLADALDVNVGDIVTIEFQSGLRETFEVAVSAVIVQYFGLGAYFDLETLNRLFRQNLRMSNINVTLAGDDVEEFHTRLKEFPGLTGTIDLAHNREVFLETLSQNVLVVTTIYAILGGVITLGVAYNSARIQLSERARELASLRILGFSRGEVAYILIGEVMLLAILAQPVGWWIGTQIARLMTTSFSSDLYAIPLILENQTYAQASLLVLGVAAASVALVARRLGRLDLIEVMKTRE